MKETKKHTVVKYISKCGVKSRRIQMILALFSFKIMFYIFTLLTIQFKHKEVFPSITLIVRLEIMIQFVYSVPVSAHVRRIHFMK